MRRWLLLAAVGLAVAETAAAVAFLLTSNHEPHRWQTLGFAVTAGLAFIASGLVAIVRRPENRSGIYLAAIGYLWLLPALTEANDAWLFTIGVALGGLAWIPFAALVLAYPSGRFETQIDRAMPIVVGVYALLFPILILLSDRRPDPECENCPDSAIAVWQSRTAADVFRDLDTFVGMALIVVVVALLVRRWRTASPALRRLFGPLLFAGAATLLAVLVASLASLVSEQTADELQPIVIASLAFVPVAFLVGILRSRLDRSAVADLLLTVGAGTPLREALRGALHDPTLEIAYWLEAHGQWVDAEGQRVPEPAGTPERGVTFVEHEGARVAALLHDPSLEEERQLVQAVATAAGFALQNERLRAELQAQYALLETIVDTAPSLLVNVDTNGRIVNLNRAVEEASGVADPEEIRTKYFWDVFIDPEEREAVIDRFTAAAPDFPPAQYENTFTNAAGEELVIAWKSAPAVDDEGNVMSIVAGGLDITERHRHAEELERERAFLNAIANNAPSLLCLIDEEGRVADQATNIAFERLLEYRPDETGGHLFWERYIVPEEAAVVREQIERVVAGEAPAEHDNYWVTQSGRRLLVAWSCTPLPRIDERTLFLISGVDVTERQRREVELRASEARLRAAIDSSPVAIVEIDLGERITAWNRAAERIFGWTAEEVLGQPVPFVPPELADEFKALTERTMAGEVISGHETFRARKDGSLINVAIAAAPLRAPTGGVVAYMALYADISVRKRRELELEHERDFLSTTANSIPSLLAVLDEHGVVTERGINTAFTRVMGYTEDELVGRSLWQVIGSTGDRASLVAAYREAVDRGVPHGAENRWVTKDGETRLVEWTSIPVMDARLGQCYLVSASDVTERKRQEAEIRASRARLIEAEEAARKRLERNLHDGAQQRLVSLSVSLRLAESLLETAPDEAAGMLAASRGELAVALDELRELARGIHPAVLTDRGLAAAVDSLVARAAIPVEVDEVADHLPPSVEAAAYYVVSEALTNVAKYADASLAHVSISHRNGKVVIDVADDGVGGADPALGSGLRGLADRVAALDGSLSVASPAGGGTRIRAEIPLAKD